MKQIEEAVEEYRENDGLEQLFEDVLKNWESQGDERQSND